MIEIPFPEFPKIPRLSREIIITEKIDGTNASIYIDGPSLFLVGSRTRWITPENDNMGFAKWAYEHEQELRQLGDGHHFGEWWGAGIQRKYDMKEKHFSLFNVSRWKKGDIPCCDVVPTLYCGAFDSIAIQETLSELQRYGSSASPGFMKPEGIVIYHTAAKKMFKKTIEKDESPKTTIINE